MGILVIWVDGKIDRGWLHGGGGVRLAGWMDGWVGGWVDG
jgi:hypothetical protein